MMARLFALIFTACLATSAEAQVFWSVPASRCVPDDDTIQFNRHSVGNASVEHAAGNVDLIVLACPVTPFSTASHFWSMGFTYRDSTGTNTQGSVRARLFRMAIGTASPTLMAEANSNSSNVMSLNTVESGQFDHTFDFEANSYWVRVELNRATTGQTVIIHSIRLDLT
jgi:hypothetical protein